MTEQPHNKSTYINHGCKCEECKAGWRDYNNELRARRKALLAENFDVVPHGLGSTYTNWTCRCDDCKAAHAKVAREARRRNG